MIVRTVTGAILALAIAASPALACKGDEIYSDDFSNADGQWANAPWFNIAGGAAELKLDPGYSGMIPFLGGNFKEFDVCVDIAYPAFKTPDAPPAAGIAFWFTDFQNMTSVLTAPVGVLGALRATKGRTLLTAPFRKHNSIKTGTGAKNTFRITAKGNNVTFYANDQRVGSFRAPPEDGVLGLFAESERDQQTSWKFSNFKLTEPPK